MTKHAGAKAATQLPIFEPAAIDGSALAERIVQARADANAFIDAQAAEMKKQFPGLPLPILRMQITNRAPNCVCRAVLINLEIK